MTEEEKKDSFTFLLIPWQYDKPIQSIEIDYNDNHQNQANNDSNDGNGDGDSDGLLKGIFSGGGDQMPKHIYTFLDETKYQIEVTPLKRMAPPPNDSNEASAFIDAAGVYAYYCANSETSYQFSNVRATSLSMACGLFSQRFYGDVFISRLGYFQPRKNISILDRDNNDNNEFGGSVHYHHQKQQMQQQQQLQMMNKSISIEEIKYAAYVSPDLRKNIISSLLQSDSTKEKEPTEESDNNKIESSSEEDKEIEVDSITFPNWLANAAKSNYEDSASLSILAASMKNHKEKNKIEEVEEDEDDNDNDNDEEDSDGEDSDENEDDKDNKEERDTKTITINDQASTCNKVVPKRTVTVQTTLCLHCRCPCKNKCPDCEGMYICEAPKQCKENGWSHQCLCKTWSVYTKRRIELSTFPFQWDFQLTGRKYQLSDEPYESVLHALRVLPHTDNGTDEELKSKSWWRTEISGWKGGTSKSAKQIVMGSRVSYKDGFALSDDLIPPERSINEDDCKSINRDTETDFVSIQSWEDYYTLRNIPLESPIALLCTFPLTLYHAVQEYGKVPIVVSKMLNRPMKIHMVGVEKELNFIDLFKEFGFLLPNDFKVELVLICREDMVPSQCSNDLVGVDDKGMKLDLTPNLTVYVQPGTYGDGLDPLFDCGTGPPDLVVGLNAGLYAYESWRSVIEFLNENPNIVGVFTDYNEHSGTNCASLGGGKCRESLSVNPFRQPRAMPVYSMNLPQFSNGFMYIFNEQELDM